MQVQESVDERVAGMVIGTGEEVHSKQEVARRVGHRILETSADHIARRVTVDACHQ